MKILQTATPTGKAHLVREGQAVTFCGRRAAFGPTGPAWPRWSPSDRGLAPIHRTACERCAAEARVAR